MSTATTTAEHETASALVPFKRKTQPVSKYAMGKAPIVPPGSVTNRSLTFVIGIMCFLAALTSGGVYLVFQAANVWTNNMSSEITVQVPQRAGDTGDAKVNEISKFLTDQNGIKRVNVFTKDQSLKLVEPWIGKAEVLKTFSFPRLIAVEIDRDQPPEIPTLKSVLEAKFPGALLDDHGLWRNEIRRLSRLIEIGGLAVIFLMATATFAVIISAARSALASNREIVEVLHLVGAEEKFIARQFEGHFVKVGIKAGVIGVGAAAAAFALFPYVTGEIGSSVASEAELRRVIGAGTLDMWGYIVLSLVVVAVALICKMTSRYGVRRILREHTL
jgi:cell division transport system permease protein